MSDQQDRPGTGPDESVGTLAEEAAKLMGALGEWARDQGSDLGTGMAAAAGQAADAARQANEHLATGAAECTLCPICRTVHLVRETSPEVREQLMVAATALLQAGSGLLASFQESQASRNSHGRTHEKPGVERIDLDDAADSTTDDWET